MGGSYWLLLLVGGSSLLSVVHCDVICPRDGRPGVNGEPGRDGLPGPKGEKGEPALEGLSDPVSRLKLKGEVGPRGAQGPVGLKGYSGHLGLPGVPGLPGEPGPAGQPTGMAVDYSQKYSAFSVIRTNTRYPQYEQPVTFDSPVVNDHSDFNLQSGYFTCSTPGVYYVTFSSMAKVSMCLSIRSDALSEKVAFCDFNRDHDQVLTGGVVLQLEVEQRVWLQSFRDFQQTADVNDRKPKQITFSGFLLF